jgi:hypothetical protein
MIRLFALRLLVIFIVIAGLASLEGLIDHDPEHVKPPKAERPDAGVHLGTPAPPAVTGADPHATGDLILVVAYLDQLEQERQAREEQERITAYLTGVAEEAARVEAERQARSRQSNPTPTPGFSGSTSCDGHVIPSYIVQRESGCNYGAVNPSGCGGNSCVGLYQFDLRHFTSGACAGLDWHNPADQDECARRISNNGSNLRPWGY